MAIWTRRVSLPVVEDAKNEPAAPSQDSMSVADFSNGRRME
ncbi:MAG: hypothetical protein ACK5MR_03170 [Cumulibacter sp.]